MIFQLDIELEYKKLGEEEDFFIEWKHDRKKQKVLEKIFS